MITTLLLGVIAVISACFGLVLYAIFFDIFKDQS